MALLKHTSLRAAPKKLAKAARKKAAAAAANKAAAPTSPTRVPETEMTDATMEEITQQKIDENATATTPAASTAVPAAEESQPEYTPAEQKMVATIASVSDKIDTFARERGTVEAQIANHRTRLVLHKWHPRGLSFDAEKLRLSHKTLHYTAGMIDENTLQQIFRLDSIQTENQDIRKLRKATVQKGNEVIKSSVALRKRMDTLKRFLPTLVATPEVAPQPTTKAVEEKKEEDVKMTDAESDSESEEEQAMQDDEEQEEKVEQPTTKKASAPSSPARSTAVPTPTLTPLQRKYQHLNLPTYAGPQFTASVHPYSGGLVIEADMEGIVADELSIVPDAKERTLTIRGVRLPERRQVSSHPFGGFFGGVPMQTRVAPHGFFTKVISLNDMDPHAVLDLTKLAATVDRRDVLQITIPRGAVKVAPKPAPQPQRRPVQHSTGVSYSSEEDEPDTSAHPFGYSAYRQPQPTYRRAPAHPFFGGGGFW